MDALVETFKYVKKTALFGLISSKRYSYSPAEAELADPVKGGVRRQIGDSFEKLRIEIVPPADLFPGRIELYLVLDYECGGKRVPDRTDVVPYPHKP
ncbi:hypothetical protein ACX9MO_16635 [Pseudooceanicola sp. 502str34]